MPCDGRAGFLNESPDVTALHVQQHRREQQAVLRGDHRRTACVLDPGDLTERNLAPWDEAIRTRQSAWGSAHGTRGIPNRDGKPLTPLDASS